MKPHVERRPACRPSERGSHLPLAPVTKSERRKIVDELILDLVARSDLEFVRLCQSLCFGVIKRRRKISRCQIKVKVTQTPRLRLQTGALEIKMEHCNVLSMLYHWHSAQLSRWCE